MYPKFIFVLIGLALAGLACNLSVNLPEVTLPGINFETMPMTTEPIEVPLPGDATSVTDLELDFGAGEMNVSPGAQNALVSGTATYNVSEFKPEVTVAGNKVTISPEGGELNTLPEIGTNIENKWDLQLGDAPLRLTIKAGAHRSEFELGGLSLQELSIAEAAADTEVSFSAPNETEMNTFIYETGASSVDLTGLGNANFGSMNFRGGAGDFTLDFSGQLQRDATVFIESGFSNLTVIVPEGIPARVDVEGGLTNVDADGAWQGTGGEFSQAGQGPALTITVRIGAGNLSLRNR